MKTVADLKTFVNSPTLSGVQTISQSDRELTPLSWMSVGLPVVKPCKEYINFETIDSVQSCMKDGAASSEPNMAE
jgi:hypothetical protein